MRQAREGPTFTIVSAGWPRGCGWPRGLPRGWPRTQRPALTCLTQDNRFRMRSWSVWLSVLIVTDLFAATCLPCELIVKVFLMPVGPGPARRGLARLGAARRGSAGHCISDADWLRLGQRAGRRARSAIR